MKNYTLIGVSVLVAAAVGWILLARDATPPIVEIASNTQSSIRATATLSPEQPKAGEPTTIKFSFTNSDGSPVADIMMHHARRVHTLIISEDLSSIGHIHPQDFSKITDAVIQSGRYAVNYTFPKAGRYIVGISVMNAKDMLEKQFIINVKGKPKMGEAATKDFRRTKCFKGYAKQDGLDRYVAPVFISDAEVGCPAGYKATLSLSADSITAGEEVQLQYHFEKDGKPVTNLEPFLDAAIHFAIVPASLDTLLHRHGVAVGIAHKNAGDMEMGKAMDEKGGIHHESVPETFGPNLVSEAITFPKAGPYQVFAQVKHKGQIIFTNFMVQVKEGFDEATAKVFNLAVADRSLSPNLISVTQDDKVIFRVSTNVAGEFHIAGYDIEKEMKLNGTIEIRFTANQAGRYNLERHPEGSEEDIVIGALVVNPK